MAGGLSRKEQWALIGLAGFILLGLMLQQWRPGGGGNNDEVRIEGQGRWRKLSEIEARAPGPGAAPDAAGALAVASPSQPAQPVAAPASVSNSPAAAVGTVPAASQVNPINANVPPPAMAAVTPLAAPPAAPPAPAAAPGPVDINRASADELDALPGIGPAKAAAIVATRQRLGGFQSVEQLDDVPGIGPKTLERLRPLLACSTGNSTSPAGAQAGGASALETPVAAPRAMAAAAAPVTPPLPGGPGPAAGRSRASKPVPLEPVNINTAGAPELESLPGIGPALAQRILEDRARRGPFRGVSDLDRVSGIGPGKLDRLRSYVTAH